MCMIVHRPILSKGKGSNIPNVVVSTALVRHPDGFGIAWRDADGLRHEKFGPNEKEEFRRLLKAVDQRRDIEYVAHFRYATHGPEDEAHAHPFSYNDPVEGTVLVFHNGIIDVTTTKEESDTEVFVRDILPHLPSAWWRNPSLVALVDMAVGWSKLVLMTATETVNLHHKAGETDGGLWYSSNHRPSVWETSTSQVNGWSGTVKGRAYESYKTFDAGYTDFDDGWIKLPTGEWIRKSDERSLVPYAGNARLASAPSPTSNASLWMHEGHELAPLQKFDFTKDSDYEASIICESCGTAGDVYIIGGKAFVDIPHVWTLKSAENDPDGDWKPIALAEQGTSCEVDPVVARLRAIK